MAKQFRVFINDVHVPNVLDIEYGLEVAKDSNGAPTDARPRLNSIRIVRRSDESTDYWAWSLEPHQESFRSGKIEVLDPKRADSVLYTVEWESGFVKCYQEIVPHVQLEKAKPQVEILDISAAVMTVNGVAWQAQGEWALM